jgi:hypothetical protein
VAGPAKLSQFSVVPQRDTIFNELYRPICATWSMATYFHYWIGAGALALLAMIVPVWLIVDDKPLEAVLIGFPVIALLAGFIAMSIGFLRKE